MVRLYTPVPANIPQTGYYNHGLGKYIRNSGDVKDALRQVKDATGKEFVEVGNERANVKPKASNYEFSDKECREMGSILQSVEG